MNHEHGRRQFLKQLSLAAASAGIAAPVLARQDEDGDEGREADRHGLVFTSTNAPAGDEVMVFGRSAQGPLALQGRAATQGMGSGAGLGSQGAVTLSASGRHLFVVNAASNSVSTFELARSGLVLRSVVDSGGLTPTSVAENDGLVVVLNAGGSGNVAGFRNQRGMLVPLADGVRSLSAAGGTAPAQVGFDPDGTLLVVSERNTNLIDSWAVRRDGTLGARSGTPSAGLTPFGFAITRRDLLVVSEAQGGAAGASSVSSYHLSDHPAGSAPRLVSGAVATTQTAACWVAVTPDSRFAYASNAGSSSVSSYAIGHDGSLALLAAQAGLTGSNAGALDAAVSGDGRHLHVLASRSLQIVSFGIGHDGSLHPLGAAGGLPAGSAGLAAN